jgi:hypothetical protein
MIIGSCSKICSSAIAKKEPLYLILGGSFGKQPYLERKLKDTVAIDGIKVITIKEPWRKAHA